MQRILKYLLISVTVICQVTPDATVKHTAPSFRVQPKDSYVVEGQPVTLTCRASGHPGPRFEWRRNGVDIIFTNNNVEKLSSNGDLTITKVDRSHIGRYQCVVKVIYSAISLTILSRTANVRFTDFPTAFSSGPQPVTGYIGGSVRLSVDISNFKPAPQIAWLYRGSAQLLSTNPKYTVLPQGVLQISDLGNENKGEVQAIARNPINNAQMRGKFATVNVLAANQRPAVKSTSSAINLIGKPKDIVLNWGKSTILECLADAPGTVVYSWLKDGKALQMGGSYSIFGRGNLKITTVKEVDTGKYTCKAQYGGAEATADARVIVQVPPQFTLIPASPKYGVVDGDVTFRYQVKGVPKPTISWTRDGVPLSADASYLEPGDGFLKATALINSDSGMYQAFATNAAGESQMAVELIIRPASVITTTTAAPAPTTSLTPGKPKNVNAYAKSPTEIFISWQPPDIQNGEIQSYRIVSYQQSDLSQYRTIDVPAGKTYTTIAGLKPNTVYVNKVAAVNKNGIGSFSPSYNVRTEVSGVTPPTAVSSISSGPITSSSIQLNWPPPSSSTVTKYVINYADVDSDPTTILSKETTSTTYQFTGLKPSTNYEFWIQAYNGKVAGAVSTRYRFKTLPAPTTGASVENLKVTPTSSTVAMLKWDFSPGYPAPDSQRIYFADMDRSPTSPSVLTVASTDTAFVQNLKPSTNYKFWIEPYLKSVLGKSSNQVTIKTPDGVPSYGPRNLQVISSTTDSLTVKWTPLTKDEANGPVTGYYIRYKIPGSKSSAKFLRLKSPLPTTTTITGLKNDTEYSIKIAGSTSAGDGIFSSPIRGRTKKTKSTKRTIEFHGAS